jgi:hypothetical protein
LKELLPEILKQVGPQQYQYLKNYASAMAGKDEAKDGDDEDVPELVNTNFEKEAEK